MAFHGRFRPKADRSYVPDFKQNILFFGENRAQIAGSPEKTGEYTESTE